MIYYGEAEVLECALPGNRLQPGAHRAPQEGSLEEVHSSPGFSAADCSIIVSVGCVQSATFLDSCHRSEVPSERLGRVLRNSHRKENPPANWHLCENLGMSL